MENEHTEQKKKISLQEAMKQQLQNKKINQSLGKQIRILFQQRKK